MEHLMMDVRTDTYTSQEVCALSGITYRMLDYWCRTGRIAVKDDASGSGTRRRWTQAELDALILCADRTREANAVLDAFQNGSLWKWAMKGGTR
jgi:hypothetical protein